jgi:hypothetical protein
MIQKTLNLAAIAVFGLVSYSIAQDTFVPNNLILDGSNKWMFHSPDDGRTTLFLVPSPDGSWNWNWNAQTQFLNNGKVFFSGDVGIGQPTPTGKLDVWGPATGSGVTIRANGGGDVLLNSGGSLFFDNNYSYASGNYIRPISSNTQSFVTSGTERIRITSTGNVGINTAAPNGRFHINSNVMDEILLNITSSRTYTTLNTWNPLVAITPTLTDNNSGNNTRIRLLTVAPTISHTATMAGANDLVGIFPSFNTAVAGDIYSPTNMLNISPAFSGQRIVSARGLYINPSFTSVQTNQFIAIEATQGDVKLATTSGKVGIGTATPGYKLDVNGSINATAVLVNGQAVGGGSQWVTGGNNVSFSTGNVGIGTTSPNQKLTVNGTIYGKQVKVDLSVPGPDYVFEKDYLLPSLDNVKSYIDENKHLPESPSAKEMQEKGIDVAEMNMMLLKKVEELTLYTKSP